MKIVCLECKTLLIGSAAAELLVDHPHVGSLITIRATCSGCGTITAFDVTNKIQKQSALERIEERIDAIFEAMPKCNCQKKHAIYMATATHTPSWLCPVHGDVWPDQEGLCTTGGAP